VDVTRSRPYECSFGISRGSDVVPIQVSLEPKMYDVETETRQKRKARRCRVTVDETYCSAVAFCKASRCSAASGRHFVGTGEGSSGPRCGDSGGELRRCPQMSPWRPRNSTAKTCDSVIFDDGRLI
jgi:hypothetical protein